jgi:hypothetical protein
MNREGVGAMFGQEAKEIVLSYIICGCTWTTFGDLLYGKLGVRKRWCGGRRLRSRDM